MKSCILSAILGAIVLFMWGYVSWMVLPWHSMAMHSFKDEKAVTQTIQNNIDQSGVYSIPAVQTKASGEMPTGPMIFTSVSLKGMPASMTMPLIISFVTQLIGTLLVAWMLSKTAGIGYIRRLGFVFVFALAAAVVTQLPAWNWFGFDTMFTLVSMADLIIGWLLAGIVMAVFK